MTAISARHLSFVAADGDILLAPLDLELPRERHGLVGRNGCGKSLLARLLAGELAASSGTVVRHAPTGFLPQTPRHDRHTLGAALGIAPKLAALSRIEAGSVDVADFDRIGDDWEFAARWRQSLQDAGLPGDFTRPLAQFSGGELMRIHLLRLFADGSRYLILDEPGNHLDRRARAWLRERLLAHPGGALVVSHDRTLLDDMEAIHELSPAGLTHYGGNYTLYRNLREEQLLAARRRLDQARRELESTRRDHQRTLERQQRRQQRAQRSDGGLPRIVAGMRQRHAEQSLGRLRNEQDRRIDAGRQRLDAAKAHVEQAAPPRIAIRAGDRGGFAVRAEGLVLPFGNAGPLDFALRMRERMHVDGRNGSGKSTLLRVLAHQLPPRAGTLRVNGRRLLVDQHFSLVDPELPALANLARLAPGHCTADYRTFLAGIGLPGDRALTPAGVLSGGERVRLALLALDATPEPYDLLLLDEPDNHLDLDARRTLEDALRRYEGAMLLVSHDPAFVRGAGIEASLCLNAC